MNPCPIKYYGENSPIKVCKLCDVTCLTCNGTLNNNCLTCDTTRYFLDNKCLTQCPLTNYYVVTSPFKAC